jgi:arylsulfatase A-like enzyme
MLWNATGVLNNQYLLPEFLAEHGIDTALINETHLQPTKKWSTPGYTIY